MQARTKHRGSSVLTVGCVTTAQIANAAGVAATGAVFFAVESTRAPQHTLFAAPITFAFSIVTCVAFLSWMRREA